MDYLKPKKEKNVINANMNIYQNVNILVSCADGKLKREV